MHAFCSLILLTFYAYQASEDQELVLQRSFPVIFVSPENNLLFLRNCFGLTLGQVREIVAKETDIDRPELVVSCADSLYQLKSSQEDVPMELLLIDKNKQVIVHSGKTLKECEATVEDFVMKETQTRILEKSKRVVSSLLIVTTTYLYFRCLRKVT